MDACGKKNDFTAYECKKTAFTFYSGKSYRKKMHC